jgi:hypothetical protein
LPLDEFLDGLGSLIPLKVLSLSKWPKQPDGTRSKPLCAQIQPEKLAA